MKNEHYNEEGKLHKIGEPARIWYDGAKEWFRHGQRHREDGPAVIWNYGSNEWYIDDHKITDKVNQFFKEHNVTNYDELTTELKILFKMTIICR